MATAVHLAFDADDRIEPQQFGRHRGVRQVDLPCAKGGDDRRRQGLHIDFEADRQRRRRIDCRNRLVHAQHVGPQLFVAEGVEAEDGLAVLLPLPALLLTLSIVIAATPTRTLLGRRRLTKPRDDKRQDEREYCRCCADESHRCSSNFRCVDE